MRSSFMMRYCLLFLVALMLGGVAIAAPPETGGPAAEAEHKGAAGHSPYGELGHGNAGKQLEDASEFKQDLAIYTFIVFLLLLAILGKFAWPPIVKALDERERPTTSNIAAAEARHEEAKRLLAEHEARLAAAAGEVRALLDEARRDADTTRLRIEADGKKAAKEELDR